MDWDTKPLLAISIDCADCEDVQANANLTCFGISTLFCWIIFKEHAHIISDTIKCMQSEDSDKLVNLCSLISLQLRYMGSN